MPRILRAVLVCLVVLGTPYIDTLSGYGFTTAGAPVHELMFVEGHKHCSALLVSSTRGSAQGVMDSSPSESFVRRGIYSFFRSLSVKSTSGTQIGYPLSQTLANISCVIHE